MAYCTAGEVLDMLKPDMLDAIIDDGYRESVQERREAAMPLAEEAAADAQAEIDGYLGKRYNVPFPKTPKIINKFAKDIALYNLASRKGVDENDREKTYLTRYNAAVAFLSKAAEGKIGIGVPEGHSTEDAAQNGFSMRSSGRIFTRGSMRGW